MVRFSGQAIWQDDTHIHSPSITNMQRDNGKVCFCAQCGRLLCDELDSEITGQQRHTHKHTYTHTHTVAPATDREPHQTSFNEVTSPKYK